MNAKIQFASEEFHIKFSVHDEFGKSIPIQAEPNASAADHFVFQGGSADYQLIAQFDVHQQENTAYIEFFSQIRSCSGYDMRHTLAPYDSVVLQLTPVHDEVPIFGSCFKIGEKCDCWAEVFHANRFSAIEQRVASLVWKSGGNYFHMLPLCDGDFKSELKNIDGHLCITASPYCSGYSEVHCKSAVVSWGTDPFEVAERAVQRGFEVLALKRPGKQHLSLSPIFDYLGWCSWDSQGVHVNSGELYQKAQELNEKNIPVRWVLVDDGWYPENEQRQISDFYEKTSQFPEGLAALVQRMKQTYGMKYMGIWECMSGGWRGIDPNGKIAQEMPDIVAPLKNKILFPRVDEPGSFAFWNRRHEYLSACGFDFVKTDVECNIETCTRGSAAVGAAARGMQYGLEGSVGLFFGGACIHCTGMGQENLWNRPIGMVSRNSEDFLHNSMASMHKFVNDNIYNSFYHSHFTTTDWDMMWSAGSPTVQMNIVLHAISGGPVYLSDPLGMSNPQTVLPFCMSDGQILKCDAFAQPTEDRLFRDPRSEPIALKAWNKSGASGVLGVFHTNASESIITDSFCPSDIPHLLGERFLVYCWEEKTVQVCSRTDRVPFELTPNSAKLYIIAPYAHGIAVLGNIEKYIAPAVIETDIDSESVRTFVLKEGGNFAFDGPVRYAAVNGVRAEIQQHQNYSVVSCKNHTGKTVVQLFV